MTVREMTVGSTVGQVRLTLLLMIKDSDLDEP